MLMKTETKIELEAFLKLDKKKHAEETGQAAKLASERSQFEAGARAKLENTIVPALEEFATMVRQNGWLADIRVQKSLTGLDMLLYRGEMRGAGGYDRPTLTLTIDRKSPSLTVQVATTSAKTVESQLQLAEITEDAIQQVALKFLKALG
jgi:hypothetical protein